MQRSEPMLPSTTPTRPSEELGVDLFHLNGQDYVILVDYRSRFPEVISLRSIDSTGCDQRYQERLRAPRDPATFSAREFSALAQSYGFYHVASSPHFPHSDGEVQRMVRTVKGLLRKSDNACQELLAYRDAPGVNGVSPAQLLMGRRLQTGIANTSHHLDLHWLPSIPFTQRDQDNRKRQASNFNRRHAVRALRPLQAGERIWVREVNSHAIVMGPAQRPCSYLVEIPTGVLQRHRMHMCDD
ncbi:uncharacterized protein LOC119459002 [Dermacentor silvarum]|uniref:uncharacterized protein LOC119459002 n=1 Tax=Dermacentor silvarum TaxID=543639 RepID=UPI001898DF71|nr:uncharacterized protein LOC119459002 [Dermacentor silvarum]